MIGSVAAIVLPLIAVANAAPAPQDPPPAPVDTAFVTNNCDFPLAFVSQIYPGQGDVDGEDHPR